MNDKAKSEVQEPPPPVKHRATFYESRPRRRKRLTAIGIAGWIMGVAYIGVLVGMTLGSIGTVTQPSVWTPGDSLLTFFVLLIPFVLGLMAGNRE